MEYLLLDMARLLRRAGIHVGTPELEDCLQGLNHLGTKISKYAFYQLVNTTMIKTPWGAEFVLWLTELYYGPDPELSNDHLQLLSRRQVTEVTGEGLGSSGQGAPVELLAEAVLKKNIGLIYAVLQGLNIRLEPHWEDEERALEFFRERSGWGEVRRRVEESRRRGELGEEEYAQAWETLSEWNRLLQDQIELQMIQTMSGQVLLDELKKHNPRTIDFLAGEERQIEPMFREIQKLGRRLAVRPGRRHQVAGKGTIALSRTVRRALQTGGIPLAPVRVRRKPAKPDLWLLCDMSNSVSPFSYFMLLFVYATQSRYAHIRTFLFVDALLEVTEHFQGQDWSDALHSMKRLKGFNLTGYSHYGKVLQQFAAEHLTQLSRKTTVIILGDGKNNGYKPEGHEALAQIKESAAALYWLNPLSRNLWGTADCLMEKYEENCTGAWPCCNIQQLEQFLLSL
ncbi:VWA domain-containing protein [Desulfitobacterium hafniense]|nr:VWA domain-containing protein [Desulfitobacterium hafniense]ACL18626.1 VWA containing CoxE family protein [Desulfitobacterium hafniense DCB-2]EHL08139.1 hypothetical protein HMPREF0322_01126 [Desulfitobacterium hafniense DP7]KTE91763.1 hypothetical protein AT727_20580 [Desulfitobacterium hafniense]CDX00596.1 Protein containing von Willebrand factor type A (VWA) domain [Desulfitobacterium hafniense]